MIAHSSVISEKQESQIVLDEQSDLDQRISYISELSALVQELSGLLTARVMQDRTEGQSGLTAINIKTQVPIAQRSFRTQQTLSKQPAALVKEINYYCQLPTDQHFFTKTMSRTVAGNNKDLLHDSLLDVALDTQDDNTGEDWLSREVALLGLTEARETDESVDPPVPLASSDNNTSQPVAQAVAVDKSSKSAVTRNDESAVQIATVY